MEYCKALSINPFRSFVLEYNHKDDKDFDQNIVEALPPLKFKVQTCPLHNFDGKPLSKVIITVAKEDVSSMPTKLEIQDKTYDLVYVGVSKDSLQQVNEDKTNAKSFTRKLKTFSGEHTSKQGECEIATWVSQCRELARDIKLNNIDKCRLIRNSLVGNALELLLAVSQDETLLSQNPECLIRVVSDAFGYSGALDDLLTTLHSLRQNPNESFADFFCRIQKHITQVQNAYPDYNMDADRERITRFIKGAIQQDAELLILNLHLRDYVNIKYPGIVPSYHQVLIDLRKEETRLSEKRRDLNSATKCKSCVCTSVLDSDRTGVSSADSTIEHCVTKLSAQVNELAAAFESFKSGAASSETVHQAKPVTTAYVQHAAQQQYQTPRYWNKPMFKPFCYNCGDSSHKVRSCKQKANPELVGKLMSERYCKPENRE